MGQLIAYPDRIFDNDWLNGLYSEASVAVSGVLWFGTIVVSPNHSHFTHTCSQLGERVVHWYRVTRW